MNNTKIFANGHCVGKVTDHQFLKVITGSRHMLRTPPAIAFSITSLTDIEQAGAESISVTDIETGLVYSTTVTHFKHYAFDLQRGASDPQKALPLEKWEVTGGKVAHQVEKNKRGKRIPAPGEDPAYTAALELPLRQLHFDIFRNYRK